MLFFVENRKPKIFGFKNVIEIRIGKIVTFVKRQIASKIFGKMKLKLSKSPKMTEQIPTL